MYKIYTYYKIIHNAWLYIKNINNNNMNVENICKSKYMNWNEYTLDILIQIYIGKKKNKIK